MTRNVTIDLDDEAVLRVLCDAMFADHYDGIIDDLRDTLATLLPKQKPAEPDEHGAKVIDKGVQYVAAHRRSGDKTGRWWFADDIRAEVRTWDKFSDDVEIVQ